MRKNVHVVPRKSKWAIQKEHKTRASKLFETQKEAVSEAKEMAKKSKSELLIHGKNGKIREKNSYGNDPYPPKG